MATPQHSLMESHDDLHVRFRPCVANREVAVPASLDLLCKLLGCSSSRSRPQRPTRSAERRTGWPTRIARIAATGIGAGVR
jgi:hypothetical protein